MNNKVIKTALLYIIYQIVLWAGHMIITLFNDYYTERIVSLVFSVALFIALICITKPKALSAVCMVLTQIILYLIVICHPNFDGWLCGYYIKYGAHGFGNGNLSWNFNIYDDALFIAISKVIYESVIFVPCAVVFAIIKRIKKSKSTEKPEPNQE